MKPLWHAPFFCCPSCSREFPIYKDGDYEKWSAHFKKCKAPAERSDAAQARSR